MTITTEPPIDLAAEVAQRQADAEQAYLALIRNPGEADAKKILAAADKAGRTAAQAQADLNTMRAITGARAALIDPEPIQRELTEAGKKLVDYLEETRQVVREREAEGRRLDSIMAGARQRLRTAQEARKHLADLEAGAWRILGTADPAVLQAEAETQTQRRRAAENQAMAANRVRGEKIAEAAEELRRFQQGRTHAMTVEAHQTRLAELQAELATLQAQPMAMAADYL